MQDLTDWQQLAAVAFLFSLLLTLGALREGKAEPGFVRLALLGNAVISSLIFAANAAPGIGRTVTITAIALVATEAGHWTGRALGALIPRRRATDDRAPWGWRSDPAGCGLSLVIGLTLVMVLTQVTSG